MIIKKIIVFRGYRFNRIHFSDEYTTICTQSNCICGIKNGGYTIRNPNNRICILCSLVRHKGTSESRKSKYSFVHADKKESYYKEY